MSAPAIATHSLHPLTAIRAAHRLLANPGDTRQVFIVIRAMRGKSGDRIFRRFANSATGAQILREKRDLLPLLEDRVALTALPDGSVGRAYLEFMDAGQLTAAALVEASEDWEKGNLPPGPDLFRRRMRDSHDLTHVLTGYGRDPLGELCLLAFMHRHMKNPGQALIVAMSWLRLPKKARTALREAWRNGSKAQWICNLDFETILARPLEAVRRELGIAAPSTYREIAP